MIRTRVELLLVLVGAVGCGIAQRTVEEANAQAGGAGAGGGAQATGGAAIGGAKASPLGGSGITAATGGMLGVAGEPPTAGRCAVAANPAPVRALSRWEHRRTVAALTGVAASTEGGDDVADETREGWFNVAMSWNAANAGYVFAEAERQGAAARDGRLLPCDVTKLVDGTCASAFVDSFVGHAFRRPLSDGERARYVGLFKTGSNNGDMAAGVELVVAAALLSPISLHKIYLGGSDASTGQSTLTGFEVASRLSYLLTGGPPDAALWDAAAHLELVNTADLEISARRLMAGPAFDDAMKHFHLQWLGLDHLDDLVSDGLPLDLLSSMRADTERFVVDVFEGDRSLPRLLGSPRAYVDARLAPRYGVPVPAQDVAAVELDPTRYFGVLTRASTLTRFNNPTQRGKFVRERLLCGLVPPPPPQIPKHIEVLPGQSRRQAWQQHVADPSCSACHRLMDDIGFGFENFDEVGLYRVSDNGQPVDAIGGLTQAGEIDGHFSGVGELASKLSQSTEVAKCVTKTWLSYALQRQLGAGDDCAVDALYDRFHGAHLDLGELLVALALDSQFRSRDAFARPAPPPLASVPGSVDTVQARRKLLLDNAIAETRWLMNSVTKEDLMVLDQYLSSLRDLEQQLSQVGPGPAPAPGPG